VYTQIKVVPIGQLIGVISGNMPEYAHINVIVMMGLILARSMMRNAFLVYTQVKVVPIGQLIRVISGNIPEFVHISVIVMIGLILARSMMGRSSQVVGT
jgi:hypothetical protein